MARGRGLMLVAGMGIGAHAVKKQAAAQQQAYQKGQQAATQQQAQQAPAAAPSKDVTAELQKLADLHKSGVLTDQEFAAAKQKLLG